MLKNLARGQEGDPRLSYPVLIVGFFKIVKGIFSPGPYPISFQGAPRNEMKNLVKN